MVKGNLVGTLHFRIYYLVCDNTLLALLVLNVPTATNRTGDPNKFNERQRYLANSVYNKEAYMVKLEVYKKSLSSLFDAAVVKISRV